ncbi:MAG TPA: Gfo/Idh/MocA family oxidoreductase [Pyrinomonadaceae bacterium]|nr:Gfo/Idh/MocA family oxidoreductase [Pyrinomonadaceae bacterium]
MKNFAMIGVAGYIAPRHLRAIKDTGNDLIAAVDKFDSVGILDSYFPHADFFVEFERFDRHVEKLKRQDVHLDFVTVCSPNYLHDAHIRFGLRHEADVICEKPVVLNPWNIDGLVEIEKETGKKVYTILQLRLHEKVIALRELVAQADPEKRFKISLKYITSRGNWYHYSWKGDSGKSGGIATNIGVHFFDMLIWVFGDVVENHVEYHKTDKAAGSLKLERADVHWELSIDENDLPDAARLAGKRTFRSILIDGQEFEFSEGFTDLHTRCYERILSGEGFGLEESRKAIDLVHEIREFEENRR